MHDEGLHGLIHRHTFGQDRRRPGEARTRIVIGITAAMMAVEIAAGLAFGSMALLADGLHMASHAAALALNAFAYLYARRHADDASFSFGTGKVNALGGFSGAVLLAVFALLMAGESLLRLFHPVPIVFDQAILVAVVGLVVNGISVLVLGVEEHGHEPETGHDPPADPGHEHEHEHVHVQEHARDRAGAHADHNLRSAYLHVLADALTSVLAIAALLAAKYAGAVFMDPVIGIVGAVLVARWSWGLLRTTSAVLLDREGAAELRAAVRDALESDGESAVADLHLWSIGPGLYSVVATVVAREPAPPDTYRARLPRDCGLVHVAIEVHRRAAAPAVDLRSRRGPGTGSSPSATSRP